jgi:hypothetical protein
MKLKLILLVMLSLLLIGCKSDESESSDHQWNNGICLECGGELKYSRTGNKEHYVCESCGKEYVFDKIMSKKKD